MSIGFTTLFSISANVTLAIFAAALVFLMLWENPRRRSNQYFALSMALFALYGAVNTAWQVPQQFDLSPKPLLYSATTLYILGVIPLFNFVLAFAGLPHRFRRVEHVLSVPIGAAFVVWLWTGHVYTNLKPLSAGNYSYHITVPGLVGVAVVLVYLASSIVLLHAQGSPKARELSVPVAILLLGVVAFSLLSPLRSYSANAIAVTIAVVMMGRSVLKHQVFQPLVDLNTELASKNNQLIEATRLKSQFLANMSHELRTPLNSIIGYTDLVLNRTYGALTDLQADRLIKVTRNGRLLLQLINDVLDLSKIEAGRLDLRFVRVPTAEMLNSLLQALEPKALEKGLKIVRGYDNLPALWVDETRARQIVSNLLSNAIKFTEQGAVIVRGHYDQEHHQVVISVTDTGIGIDPANQEKIFEAFHQTDSSLSRQYEGTGLGLAITRRLVELHQGRIWFESTLGRGSTFHVALPAAEETPQAAPTFQPHVNATGPVILAIDDDEEAIEVLQGHLEAAHFRVYGACNANDGLRMAHELSPDLITLDIRMPGTDGWQFLEALRQDPDTASIPVLIVSATDDRQLAEHVGADGFLNKPVQPATLVASVRRLLAQADHRQEVQS